MSRQSDGVLLVLGLSDLPLSSPSNGTGSTKGGGSSGGSKPQHPPPMADWFKVHNDLLDDDDRSDDVALSDNADDALRVR